MFHDIIKKLIIIVVALIVILALVYGVLTSEFTNIKKYDEEDSVRTMLNKKLDKNKESQKTIQLKDGNMANLGDFTLNISGNRELTINISLKYKQNKENSWLSGNSVEDEIVKKGDILRSVVISTVSDSKYASVANQGMKKELVSSMNNYLSDGEIEEVYFNKFIIK